MSQPSPQPALPVFHGRYELTRYERVADGAVHAVGIVLAIVAGAVLLTLALPRTAPAEYAAAVFYVISLLTVLVISCLYNMWPVSPAKWMLRRFDHGAIFLLIAGTYTPFLTQLHNPVPQLATVWTGAIIGILVKLFLPGRFDRLAIVFYLGIGWSGLLAFDILRESLSERTLWYIAAGGVAYSSGVVFFLWKRLRFQSALWHCFVVAGAALHLVAVADCLVINRL